MKVFFYTSKGLPPHLSQVAPESLQLSLPHFYSLAQMPVMNKMTLVEYLGMKEQETFLTIKDVMNSKLVAGCADESKIRIFAPHEQKMTVQEYMHFLSKTGVTYATTFGEEASLSSGMHKGARSAKGAVRTLDESVSLKPPGVKLFANIQGGKSVEKAKMCASVMKSADVDGFYIGGIYADDPWESRKETVIPVCNELKEVGKPIYLSGPGSPMDIILGALHGVTYFECSHPFTQAQAGIAMVLPTPDTSQAANTHINFDYEYQETQLNLKSTAHRADTDPISPNCSCYTCQHHSVGYIHHLLSCDELTGTALLTMHNVHSTVELVKGLEAAKERGEAEKVCGWLVNYHMQCMVEEDSAQ